MPEIIDPNSGERKFTYGPGRTKDKKITLSPRDERIQKHVDAIAKAQWQERRKRKELIKSLPKQNTTLAELRSKVKKNKFN